MRYHDAPPLFSQGTLYDALRAQTDAVLGRVQAISEAVLCAVDDMPLVSQLADELKIVPLSLNRPAQTMRREEIQIDVTGDPFRCGYADGRRLLVPGIRVTVSIPYAGDEQLWRFRPSTFRLTNPRGIVHAEPGMDRGILDLVIEQAADQPIERIKAELDSRLDDITFFIDNQAHDLVGFDQTLRQHIQSALSARRARLQKHDGLAELLGIPEVNKSSVSRIASQPLQTQASAPSPNTTQDYDSWDVFVSHASEDKDSFVRPLVSALTSAGLKVWFDEMELRVGDSLRRSIDRGLARSSYGAVVISPSFLAKHWPQKELDGLIAREEDGRKVVLPVWHDISAAEIRRSSPTLADRLAVSSSRGIDEVARELLRVIRPT